MKNQLLIKLSGLAFTLVLFLTLLLGCEKESINKDYHLQNIDKVISDYNFGKLPNSADWGTKLEGNIKIIAGSNEILIQFDDPKAENVITYFLQTEKALDLKSSSFGLAEIIFLKRELVINSLERKQTLLFALSDVKTNGTVQNLEFSNKYFGYGLGLENSIRGSITPRSSSCKCHHNSLTMECQSGGVGSTDCSIGAILLDPGCTVNCASGYYSCCNP